MSVNKVKRIDPTLKLNDETGETRILVLGRTLAMPGITSVGWDAISAPLNVADFELVVVDLSLYPDSTGTYHSNAVSSLSPDRVWRLLRGPSSELVLIGDASLATSIFEKALPSTVTVRSESGSNLTITDNEFESYLRHVGTYDRLVSFDDISVPTEWSSLIVASRRDTVGAAVRWFVDGVWSMRTTLLPPADGLDPVESIECLLRIYGLSVPTASPVWLSTVSLPSLDALSARLDSLNADLMRLDTERQAVEAEHARASEPLRTLLETGFHLEVLVRDVLRRLGADVEEPTRAGEDDGVATTPDGTRLVLEIKGREGPIGRKDVRQLADWVDNWRYPDEDSDPLVFRGLLVGNAYRLLPPSDRPSAWAPNAVDLAQRQGLAMISTTELLDALHQVEVGDFDAAVFWRRVSESSGPVFPV